MGRIAEALKRAQQERARRIGDSAGATAIAPELDQELNSGAQLPGTLEHHYGEVDAPDPGAMFDAPAPPSPFPLQTTPLLPEAVDQRVVVFHDSSSDVAERYRTVRTRILSGNPSGASRVLAITSALPKEGKTVTAANLGFVFAELRHLRVALIDLDFRKRGLSTLFDASDTPGIAEVIRGEMKLADACRPIVRPNCYLLTAGDPQGSSVTELLGGAQASAVFRELAQRFNYTLIDSPPVDTTADIGLIAPLCHSVIMVARMNQTPESLLCRSVRLLQASNVPIAGCILAGYSDSTMAFNETHDYFEGPA